ncbi:S8 family serine peptidase [Actinoallomurus iriomotensis]|uniref:S8 family serine peptidase n=1 Tax=Actinoallomurus iriomotensis TaxID=478107 RepID=UPI00255277F2|nr:S8 family serine peptidase [Actinoallomurus iriomotensis]
MSEVRRALPRVASAVLVSIAVGVLSVPAAQSASPSAPTRPAAAPADLYRGQQWTLDALHISRAWRYSRGNGVTVAVLDTGVDGHQADLAGRVIDGPDFTGHGRKPGGRYWGRHGTEMASLIAGHGHGAGATAGVMGVAPDAKILSIRVTWELNDPVRNDHAQVNRARDAVAKGIRYAADHGAQVISMSLGGGNLFYNGNAAEEAAIKYALGKGTVLVASAGNDGDGANRRNYPAAYPGVIAVGATDRAFKAAKFTNRHTYISVAAPGVEIVSADAAGHGYILGTGTSSSAAFVAGMSALVKARYPNLTAQEVKQALEEGATHRPPDGRSNEIGTGVADAYGALRTAARINKAEHDGTSVHTPPTAARPAPTASEHSDPDLMLIAVLSGGGTLILLSLILGWRQRRRRIAREKVAVEPEEPERSPMPVAAHASSAPASRERRPSPPPSRTGRSSGLSPWERRPEPAAEEELHWDAGPPEASPPVTPWDRHPSSPADGAPHWDSAPSEASPPVTPWDRRPNTPADDAPHWDPAPSEASPPVTPWDRHPSSPADDAPHWDPAPSEASPPVTPWDRRPNTPADDAPHWDPASPEASPPVTPWDRHESAGSWDPSPNGTAWDRPGTSPPGRDERPPAEPWEHPETPAPSWDRLSPAERSWDEPPPADRSWDLPPADSASPTESWDRLSPESSSPTESWDRLSPEPSSPAESWDRLPPESSSPTESWDRLSPEPSSPTESWDRLPADPSSPTEAWGQLPADPSSPTEAWDRLPAETSSPTGASDRPEPGEPEARETPPAEPPVPGTPPPARPFEPFEPPPRDPAETNGHPTSAYQDLRGAEPDPLSDDSPFDSSSDVGTPLADESWESIRRGFDRLKDMTNWESSAKSDLDDTGSAPAQDASDETAALPTADPDEDHKRPPS